MIDPNDFAAPFGDRPVPEPLLALLRFQNELRGAWYSAALRLSAENRSRLARGWSADPAFLSRLIPFARAGASGSFYALWDPDPSRMTTPAQWPVVAFGEDGGEWVVARDVRELLVIGSCDAEPRIDFDRAHYVRSEHHYRKSDGLDAYGEWLRASFQLEPVEDPDAILQAAQAEWQEELERWVQGVLEEA
ncbi:hypothetical protein [Roseateles sp. MS654]|uniref:hypothetical protein n=1 Tax=Roseateles sp. MS654 TaxID=3412685 RepID=UPI003C2B502D